MANIVIWDPRGEFWEGALVDGEIARNLENRGVTLLPVAIDNFRSSAIAGYFKRSWGGGWPIGTAAPKMACPMVLYCYPGLNKINFAARFVPESEDVNEKFKAGLARGFVRFTTDSSQAFGYTGGLIPTEETLIEFKNAGAMDELGGWTIKGSAKIDVREPAPFAFALYGSVPGIRVSWTAVTQSP